MKNFLLFGIVLLMSGILGCASMNVAIKYDEDVDFTDFKTFFFVKPSQKQGRQQGRVQNRFFSKEVMQEIEPIMESKGFAKTANKEDADLLVIFYGSVHNQRNYSPPTYHVGRWGRVRRISPGHTYNVKKGALVIDIVDRAQKELIWQGVGKGVVSPNQPAGDLVKAVDDILEKFPPQVKM